MLLVTHDVDEAIALADRIVVHERRAHRQRPPRHAVAPPTARPASPASELRAALLADLGLADPALSQSPASSTRRTPYVAHDSIPQPVAGRQPLLRRRVEHLPACSSAARRSSGAPLSSRTAARQRPCHTSEWSQYTFTIGDNGGDGSQELAEGHRRVRRTPRTRSSSPGSTTARRWCRPPPPATSTSVRRRRPADHRRGEGVRLQDRRRSRACRTRRRPPRTSSCPRIRRSRRWPTSRARGSPCRRAVRPTGWRCWPSRASG